MLTMQKAIPLLLGLLLALASPMGVAASTTLPPPQIDVAVQCSDEWPAVNWFVYDQAGGNVTVEIELGGGTVFALPVALQAGIAYGYWLSPWTGSLVAVSAIRADGVTVAAATEYVDCNVWAWERDAEITLSSICSAADRTLVTFAFAGDTSVSPGAVIFSGADDGVPFVMRRAEFSHRLGETNYYTARLDYPVAQVLIATADLTAYNDQGRQYAVLLDTGNYTPGQCATAIRLSAFTARTHWWVR